MSDFDMSDHPPVPAETTYERVDGRREGWVCDFCDPWPEEGATPATWIALCPEGPGFALCDWHANEARTGPDQP